MRNPSPDQTAELSDETEIIASTSEYGTRQSNKGSGGGAIYGCRSSRQAADRKVACVRANNLSDGRAFSFETAGPVAGEILVGNDTSQPFATNGRGRVENLNADMVDSTDIGPVIANLPAGQSRPIVQVGSLRVEMACAADGDITVTATTEENGIIHAVAFGVTEGQTTTESKDDTFSAGEVLTTGFDQSHSGFIRYLDDDEAITVDLSTDEQGGSPPNCAAFGSFTGGPHVTAASPAAPPAG